MIGKNEKNSFLMPVYNDWESFNKLLDEINFVIKDIKEFSLDCIVINDFSTIELPTIKASQYKLIKNN